MFLANARQSVTHCGFTNEKFDKKVLIAGPFPQGHPTTVFCEISSKLV